MAYIHKSLVDVNVAGLLRGSGNKKRFKKLAQVEE